MRSPLKVVLWLIVIALVVIGGVRFYAGRESEVRSWAGAFVSFDKLPPKGSDHFATCPPESCGSSADAESPIFPVSADRLHDIWVQTIGRDPRLRLVKEEQEGRFMGYVQRSPILGLPDLISVEFLSEGNSRSSIKIYSASRYEALDFGGNRRRVEEWMHRLVQNFPDGMPLGG